ncbi:MAG: hypothetical protein IT326_04225, partial [Anaerolineae bacterium]|nr:hypothetical protein [Anaerolineae bacterium]
AAQDHLGLLNDAAVAREIVRGVIAQVLDEARDGPEMPAEGYPGMAGMFAYIRYLQDEAARLRASFPTVWEPAISPDIRQALANAISMV